MPEVTAMTYTEQGVSRELTVIDTRTRNDAQYILTAADENGYHDIYLVMSEESIAEDPEFFERYGNMTMVGCVTDPENFDYGLDNHEEEIRSMIADEFLF